MSSSRALIDIKLHSLARPELSIDIRLRARDIEAEQLRWLLDGISSPFS